MIALLDSDSLLWILAYNYRGEMDQPSADMEISIAADNFVKTILTIVQADSYVGVFSPDKNFRHEVYKYAPYKGQRPEKPDWFVRFAPIIKERLMDKWGFFVVPDLEADDVICALAEYYEKGHEFDDNYQTIICSPDKDLRQIAGLHYDYKKEGATVCSISAEEAEYNFWYQMLAGDTSDCVAGVPGLGPVKSKKLLKDCKDSMQWSNVVMSQYRKYFGEYYGPIIYQETKDTLQLMCSRHRLWNNYDFEHIGVYNRLHPLYSLGPASPFEEFRGTNTKFVNCYTPNTDGAMIEGIIFEGTINYEQLDDSLKTLYNQEKHLKNLEEWGTKHFFNMFGE